MSEVLQRETNTITIANFWENYLLGKYEFEPPYQRNSVWSEEKQSFLIDSILKNFPIPPIFLHQKIDTETGKTQYDVIDGKQRLKSIIKFIENVIPASSELENSVLFDERLAGAYFKDLDEEGLSDIKKKFWRYSIPIEYVDANSNEIIDAIFDRLNRNGEPLNGQELRRSNYHASGLLKTAEDLADIPFWKGRLKNTDVSRMEDIEFVSELMFVLLEKKPLHGDQKTLDEFYAKYTNTDTNWDKVRSLFSIVTGFMKKLSVKYFDYKVDGVSHLYALWCVSHYCVENDIDANFISGKVDMFYRALRSIPLIEETAIEYKKSMSTSTRMMSQRKRRVRSLVQFLGI